MYRRLGRPYTTVHRPNQRFALNAVEELMPHPTRIRAPSTGFEWQADHSSRYLASGGTEGHVIDLSAIGGLTFTTCLLLRNVGRKSGKTMYAPLIYGDLD